MPAYDYASATGYARARPNWIDYPDLSTPIRAVDINRWEQALYDVKRNVFNVRDYLAKGDGVTDDTTAFQNAINAAQLVFGTVYVPAGTYRIAGQLNVTAGIAFLGDGAEQTVLLFDDVNNTGLTLDPGTFDVSSAITVDTTLDGRTATVANGALFAVNDEVYIQDLWNTSATIATFQERWITRISAISGNVLTFEDPMPVVYHSAKTATVQKRSTGFVRGFTAQGIYFKNATSPGRPVNRSTLMKLTRSIDPYVTGCRLDGSWGGGLWVSYTRGAGIFENRFDHMFSPAGQPVTSALTIAVENSVDFRIVSNKFRRCGQGINASFGCCQGVIANNLLFGAYIQAGTPGVTNLPASPTDEGGRGIKLLGASRVTVVGNNVTGFGYEGVRFSDCAYCLCVAGSIEHIPDVTSGSGLAIGLDAGTGGDGGGRNDHNIIRDMVIRDCQSYAVISTGGLGFNTIKTNTITKSNVTMGQGAIYLTSPDCDVEGNTINSTTSVGVYLDTGAARTKVRSNSIVSCTGGFGVYAKTANNEIVGNYIDTIGSFGSCIALDVGSSACLVADNVCKNSNGSAINSASGSGGNVIGRTLTPTQINMTLHATDILLESTLGTFAASGNGGTYTPDPSNWQHMVITTTGATAITFNAPANPTKGMILTFDILNSSGGAMGTITWNAAFKLAGAFTNPANTKRRTIQFRYDGTSWIELARAAADI